MSCSAYACDLVRTHARFTARAWAPVRQAPSSAPLAGKESAPRLDVRQSELLASHGCQDRRGHPTEGMRRLPGSRSVLKVQLPRRSVCSHS